jgi:hypothetical protein
MKDPGDLDGDGIAVIPVKILATVWQFCERSRVQIRLSERGAQKENPGFVSTAGTMKHSLSRSRLY